MKCNHKRCRQESTWHQLRGEREAGLCSKHADRALVDDIEAANKYRAEMGIPLLEVR